MNIKLFDKYISICKELGQAPTWEGLRNYKEKYWRFV